MSVYIVALVLVVIKIFIKIILISHINITSTLPRPSSSSSFLNLHPLHLFILFMSSISSIPCLAPIICKDNIFIKINKTIGINIACTLPPSIFFLFISSESSSSSSLLYLHPLHFFYIFYGSSCSHLLKRKNIFVLLLFLMISVCFSDDISVFLSVLIRVSISVCV